MCIWFYLIYMLQYCSETSVTRINIICAYHLLFVNHLTGVQKGIFIDENDLNSFVFQDITAFMSGSGCIKHSS